MQPAPAPNAIVYAVIVVVILAMLFFRGRRMAMRRPLKLGTLWVVPAIFLAVTALNFVQFPPHAADWPWLAAAILLGALLGWQRGRLMDISVEPGSGQLMVQGSRWAILFLAALILIRMAVRGGLNLEAQAGVISPALINDGFVIFALGLFGTQCAEMGLRALRLARAHAAGKGAAADEGPNSEVPGRAGD